MILIKHLYKKYINAESNGGFCENPADAKRFPSVFSAMKFLAEQDEDDITEYDFIDDTKRTRNRQ